MSEKLYTEHCCECNKVSSPEQLRSRPPKGWVTVQYSDNTYGTYCSADCLLLAMAERGMSYEKASTTEFEQLKMDCRGQEDTIRSLQEKCRETGPLLSGAKIDRVRAEAKYRELLKMTESLDQHPGDYDGPCWCKMCQAHAAEEG